MDKIDGIFEAFKESKGVFLTTYRKEDEHSRPHDKSE